MTTEENIKSFDNNEFPHSMPWTAEMMPADELRQWRASRTEAGRLIDIETCEIRCWYAHAQGDVYGIDRILGDEPWEKDPECQWSDLDKYNFVRSPDSDGWVCECDLPPKKWDALYVRIRREAEIRTKQH